jgi:peptidylprolyl isomerase
MSIKSIIGILVAIAAIVAIVIFSGNGDSQIMSDTPLAQQNQGSPVAVFDTNKGTFEVLLYTQTMPITSGNFVTLAEDGYFDGTKFHRVIPNFMIQGGDPNTKDDTKMDIWGTGGPGYAIEDEHIAGHSNVRGTISMANSGPQTGGSQFFVNVADNTFLDFDQEPLTSKHPVFGEVISGLEIVDQITEVQTTGSPFDRPLWW